MHDHIQEEFAAVKLSLKELDFLMAGIDNAALLMVLGDQVLLVNALDRVHVRGNAPHGFLPRGAWL